MRYLYSLLFYLSTPFIMVYLCCRARKNPEYAKNWHERFGFFRISATHNNKNKRKAVIWLHSVSVGETRAIAQLIELISIQYPSHQIITTHMTPTGRKTAQELYPQVQSYYIPYDMPHAVINFYKTFKPQLALLMETEIWPNVIFYAHKYQIPICLINARLSQKSYLAYSKIRYLICPILNQLTMIMAQDKQTHDNFLALGFIGKIAITGSTKFDLIIKHDELLKSSVAQLFSAFTKVQKMHKIVVFASTRDGEEAMILHEFSRFLPNNNYLLLIVPRHPERFLAVEKLIQETGCKYQKRSNNVAIELDTQIVLGDSLGELMAYYVLSDVAVIGGSFADFGSHNPIEPLYLHKPIIFGPSTYNFAQISQDAKNCQCALQVVSMHACFKEIENLLGDNNRYQQLKQHCQEFIDHYQGASAVTMQLISPLLKIDH